MTATMDGAPAELLLVRELESPEDGRRLRREAEQGHLTRLRRGVYLPTARWAAAGAMERALLALHAFALVAERPPVFSHQSAALLHGLPFLRFPDRDVHILTRCASGGRASDGVRRHAAAAEVAFVEVGGLRVTTLERTLVDLAAVSPFAEAVAFADAALAAGGSLPLAQAEADSSERRAWRKVQRVLDFATPLAESPGESVSRLVLHRLNFPAPILQHSFRDWRGSIGRVDFWWPEQRVVGEFDGRVKYQGRYGERPEDTVWREKRREDRLRALGLGVARWTWQELEAPQKLAAVVLRAGLAR
jgi:hypothetical protein